MLHANIGKFSFCRSVRCWVMRWSLLYVSPLVSGKTLDTISLFTSDFKLVFTCDIRHPTNLIAPVLFFCQSLKVLMVAHLCLIRGQLVWCVMSFILSLQDLAPHLCSAVHIDILNGEQLHQNGWCSGLHLRVHGPKWSNAHCVLCN